MQDGIVLSYKADTVKKILSRYKAITQIKLISL